MERKKTNILNFSLHELEAWMATHGAQAYRARQIWQWLFAKDVREFEDMTDLPAVLRRELSEHFFIHLPRIVKSTADRDGAVKFLCELQDGEHIEAVLLPDDESQENTLCLSVQVGCKYGCGFCYTATMGFKRNLKSGEIFGEYLAVKSQYPPGFKIHRLVVMGMGEALDNFDELKKALEIFTSRQGLGFSARRITVSTAGVIPQIAKAWALGVNLAISLNASEDAKRARLMPITRKYPLKELVKVLKSLDTSGRQKLTIEYVLLKGVNDSVADAGRLALLLSGLNLMVNLIRFNPFPGCEFQPADEPKALAFQERLRKAGFMTFLRKSKGREILAACGQLAGRK